MSLLVFPKPCNTVPMLTHLLLRQFSELHRGGARATTRQTFTRGEGEWGGFPSRDSMDRFSSQRANEHIVTLLQTKERLGAGYRRRRVLRNRGCFAQLSFSLRVSTLTPFVLARCPRR